MADHSQEITDGIGVADAPDFAPDPNTDHVEVKGPDSEEWGDDEDRPSSTIIPTSAVNEDGEPIEVKGPDPAVWGD